MRRPQWHEHLVDDAAREHHHHQLAPYGHETVVPNEHGFYQIAPPKQSFHQIGPAQQMFLTDARYNDHAVPVQVPCARDEADQHHDAHFEDDDIDQPRRPTPTPSETTALLPLFAALGPSDSVSNHPCQSDTPYLSEAECARNYPLAKHHLVSGWKSLYPGATVPDDQSNIPALQVRIQRMRQWAGYEHAVARAQQHLDEALELL